MGEEFHRRGDVCPQLLDLIPKEKKEWKVVGDANGFGAAEERKLELRLGLPGDEEDDWSAMEMMRGGGGDPSSVRTLRCFPKSSAANPSAGAKRGFLHTVESKPEGFKQQHQMPGFLQLQGLLSQQSSGKAEQQQQQQQQQQQALERKPCCPSSSSAHGASGNATGATNSSHIRNISVPVVGWPPIRSFRKNLASIPSKPLPKSQEKNAELEVKFENCRKGLFVKINMDGIPIGRKIDLKAYNGYEKLASAVEELFRDLYLAQRNPLSTGAQNAEEKQTFTGLLDGSGEYTLVYEDTEGDKMLVGDVPWEMFVSTAKRLRVLKSSELSALSLGAISSKRTEIN